MAMVQVKHNKKTLVYPMHYGDQHTVLILSIESDHRLLELLKVHKNIVERIHFKGLIASFLLILPSHCASHTLISSYHFPSVRASFRDQGVGNGMAGFLYRCATEDLKILKIDE